MQNNKTDIPLKVKDYVRIRAVGQYYGEIGTITSLSGNSPPSSYAVKLYGRQKDLGFIRFELQSISKQDAPLYLTLVEANLL